METICEYTGKLSNFTCQKKAKTNNKMCIFPMQWSESWKKSGTQHFKSSSYTDLYSEYDALISAHIKVFWTNLASLVLRNPWVWWLVSCSTRSSSFSFIEALLKPLCVRVSVLMRSSLAGQPSGVMCILLAAEGIAAGKRWSKHIDLHGCHWGTTLHTQKKYISKKRQHFSHTHAYT